jgi:hypothetical protein
VTTLAHRVEGLSGRLFAALAGGAVAVPAMGAVLAEGAASVALGGASAIALAIAGWAWRERARARELPLVIEPSVVACRIDGQPAFRFKVRLGNGRLVRGARARVTWRPAAGDPVELAIVGPEGPRLGEWTVLAFDTLARVQGDGSFVVEVTAQERDRHWKTEAQLTGGHGGPPHG